MTGSSTEISSKAPGFFISSFYFLAKLNGIDFLRFWSLAAKRRAFK